MSLETIGIGTNTKRSNFLRQKTKKIPKFCLNLRFLGRIPLWKPKMLREIKKIKNKRKKSQRVEKFRRNPKKRKSKIEKKIFGIVSKNFGEETKLLSSADLLDFRSGLQMPKLSPAWFLIGRRIPSKFRTTEFFEIATDIQNTVIPGNNFRSANENFPIFIKIQREKIDHAAICV